MKLLFRRPAPCYNRPMAATDVPPFFARHRPLLSDRQWESLRSLRYLVAGAGGLGSNVLDQLVRLGVAHLEVWDPGVLDEPDLNRQSLYTRMDLGRPKVEAARERLAAIHPDIELHVVSRAIEASSALGGSIGGVDICFDCLDTAAARRGLEHALVDLWTRAGSQDADASDDPGGIESPRILVHGGVSGFTGQVVVFRPPAFRYRDVFGDAQGPAPSRPLPVLPSAVVLVAATQIAEHLRFLENPDAAARLISIDARELRHDVVELKPASSGG